MTNDLNSAGPFTPGASAIDTPPIGDVERQGVASLRGCAYQVVAAALAWLDLDQNGRIYLEVAEDYATVAQQSLDATQVKDTVGSGSITLNTEAVRDAIDAFIRLTAANKGRLVKLRYLTTAPIGTELKTVDRPGGVAGLIYWRQAATSADVGPLRALLTSNKFSADVQAFVNRRDDETLRRELLQRVHWDCGHAHLTGDHARNRGTSNCLWSRSLQSPNSGSAATFNRLDPPCSQEEYTPAGTLRVSADPRRPVRRD